MRRRNILLLQPLRIYKRWPMPEDFTGLISSTPTLAFAQLAGALKEHQITYLDGIARDPKLAELTAKVAAADMVLINAHSSIGAMNVEANVRHIQMVDPAKVIILGGHHATLYDQEWLGRGAHFVVRGEGEVTIVELLAALEAGGPLDEVAGISWRGPDGRFHRNPDREQVADLDQLPLPDWTILDPGRYHLPLPIKGYATTVETSRGCGHGCQFCAASKMWRNRQRFKSAERVLEELRVLQRLGYRRLWFADDNFLADPERDNAIFEGILREGISLQFMAFMRADSVARNPDLVATAARAGLRNALVGFESPVQRILTRINKAASSDEQPRAAALLRRHGVFIGGFFMVGYLDETPEETAAVFRAAAELADFPIISIFEPRRGTPDFFRSVEQGEVCGGDQFYHNTVDAINSQKQVLGPYRRFYANFFRRPRTLRQLLIGTPAQRAFFRALYTNMARSVAGVTPNRAAHPWKMVQDIHS